MENENSGMYLLQKGKRGFFRMVFSRMGLVLAMLLLNIALLLYFFYWFEEFLPHFYGGSAILMVAVVLILINSSMDATAKITWLVVIMLAPVFGALLFLFVRKEAGHRAMAKRVQKILNDTRSLLPENDALQQLTDLDAGAGAMARYVQRISGCPVYQNTDVTYFSQGEAKFQQLLVELEKAEKFIFLEYFIVDEGVMWGRILDILARKAAEGVDVRVLYDGACEFLLLPKGYPKKLKALGIQCKVFSPATPFVSTHYNYRDHRKILVIDGHTGFTGGINLSDEYINIGSRFGHWKDTAVMLRGEAVRSLTLMFLQMWNLDEKEGTYCAYLDSPMHPADGFVMPYWDSPLDSERMGQRVYMDILARAKRYVHIMTPYLILDQEMENALKYAAARGVEVKLIMPGIPDKKAVNILGKTYYKTLLDSGVEIYEYSPGFVHAKVFVSDDTEAVVGTINLDYRSLYHHFECAAYLYGANCIADIETDYQDTLRQCREVTHETVKKEKWYNKVVGYLLKVAAPLL